MKVAIFILFLGFAACGPESSPEGRMTLKLKEIQSQLDSLNGSTELKAEIDSLKRQNSAILDSIGKINAELRVLKEK
ncbi:hypothetical protein ACFSJU_13480 [Paradesertivirga mongoliensis]|uniref:Uncharacterized protein n=1 Tax=Paradesertivirga mongoliensis TaxID=2100740 RepID=A0ABW4ZN42_9SPHI|nr:hypothetical protein [Pedobacter mongoliensis]